MKSIVAAVVLGLFGFASVSIPEMAQAKPDPAKLKDIHRLLKLTGAAQIGKQVMTTMLQRFRSAFRDVPDAYWDQLIKSVKMQRLINDVAVIYGNNITHDDIKGLIAFYQSPLGKRFLAVQPQLMQESMVAGQKWAEAWTARVMKDLKKRKHIK
jgi:hypothetical protein